MKQASITIEQWHELALNGAAVTARVIPRGSSMRPIIRGGKDEVEIRPFVYRDAPDDAPDPSRLSVGDIAVFRRADGAYIIHRVMKIYYVQHPDQPGHPHDDPAQPGHLQDTPQHPDQPGHPPADTSAMYLGPQPADTSDSRPGTGRSTPCPCSIQTTGTGCAPVPCICFIRTQGDNCPGPDTPVPAESVIGIVTAIYRDGRTIAPSGPAALAAAAIARRLAYLRRKAALKLHCAAKPGTPAAP